VRVCESRRAGPQAFQLFVRIGQNSTDEVGVTTLRRRAESVFEIAICPAAESENAALVVDRSGGMRVLNCAAWSLPAIISEYGASEVYLIERKSGELKVEGWSATETFVVTRTPVAERFARLSAGLTFATSG